MAVPSRLLIMSKKREPLKLVMYRKMDVFVFACWDMVRPATCTLLRKPVSNRIPLQRSKEIPMEQVPGKGTRWPESCAPINAHFSQMA
ncbi:hypothetical protein D3C86_1831520 [compost metagenome]